MLTLKCSSLGGFPIPTIRWTKSVLKHRSDHHQRLSGHHRAIDTNGHRHKSADGKGDHNKSADYQKITDHEKVSRSNGHGHGQEMVSRSHEHGHEVVSRSNGHGHGHEMVNKDNYDEKEISGLDTRSGHSGISSEVVIRITPSDNHAIYKCLVFNEAINEPKVSSVLIDEVHFMSDKLTTSTDTVNFWSDSIKAPTDYTEVTCSSGECNPRCNISWYLNGQLINEQLISGQLINNGKKQSTGSNSANFLFKINTSYTEGLYGSSLTFSKLIISNRRKSWSSNDDGSKITCITSNTIGKDVKKNITVSVLCEYFSFLSSLGVLKEWEFWRSGSFEALTMLGAQEESDEGKDGKNEHLNRYTSFSLAIKRTRKYQENKRVSENQKVFEGFQSRKHFLYNSSLFRFWRHPQCHFFPPLFLFSFFISFSLSLSENFPSIFSHGFFSSQ